MTTPEIQKNTPTSSNSPSDTLLRNFRATLDQRWEEFNKATLDEAISQNPFGSLWAEKLRNQNGDYISAKVTFDRAKSILTWIKTDVELKESNDILAEVEIALSSLTKYLRVEVKPEERNKAHNIILAKTTADLSQFRADITGKASDKKEAETAIAAEKAIPRAVVATAAATTGGLSILSSAEATTARDEIKNEIGGELKKTIGPWGMIFQWVKWSSPKEVATHIKELSKEYSEKKWTSDPIDKIFAFIKLFFLKSQISRAGMDLSGEMTPEEMKLAGIVAKVENPTTRISPEKPIEKDKYTPARIVFETLLLDKAVSLPYTDILDNIQMRGTSMWDLEKIYKSKDYTALLTRLWLKTDEQYKIGIENILMTLFAGNKAKYVLEAYNSKKLISKTSPHPKDVKFSDYLITAGGVIRKMWGIAKASVSHVMPESSIKFDSNSQNVVFTDTEEWDETLKLFWGDKKVLVYMLGTNSGAKVKMNEVDKTIDGHTIEQLYPEISERKKAQETVKKVMNFGKSFMQWVINNPDLHLGMNGELQSIMTERAFSMKAYALIYMTLGGRDISNFSQLSTIEQAQIYGIVMTIFQTEESNYKKGQLTSRYLSALMNSTSEIPKWVTEFFKDAGMYVWEKWVNALVEWTKYIIGLAWENPKLAAIFAALNIPWIPARNTVVDLF